MLVSQAKDLFSELTSDIQSDLDRTITMIEKEVNYITDDEKVNQFVSDTLNEVRSQTIDV